MFDEPCQVPDDYLLAVVKGKGGGKAAAEEEGEKGE
jgi:hypothetical protein